MKKNLWPIAVGLALVCGACVYNPDFTDQCQLDPETCRNHQPPNGWPTLPGCTLGAPLQVQVGQGAGPYAPFAPGEAPVLQSSSGGGQGGSVHHVWAGVRIVNPDPVGGSFLVEFAAKYPAYYCGYNDSCEDLDAGSTQDAADASATTDTGADAGSVPFSKKITTANASYVLAASLTHAPDGSLSRGGMRIFVGETPTSVSVTVHDQCGRVASDTHVVGKKP